MSNQLKDAMNRFAIMREKNRMLVQSVPSEKIMTIPKPFNNSIYWQAGHLVVVQASLLYERTGLATPVDKNYKHFFGKGQTPDHIDETAPSIEEIIKLMGNLITVTRDDMADMIDLNYKTAIEVSTGHIVGSYVDALNFLPLHEAYHFGSMRALLKLI